MRLTDLGNGRQGWIGHCTCGVKLVDGNLERAHHPTCECSVVPFDPNPVPKDHPRPTAKQVAYLEHPTTRAGEPPLPYDELTIKLASVEIDRLHRLLGIPVRPKSRGSKSARRRTH